MSDDLEAQIEHNSMTDSCYKDKVISTPLVLQLVKAYLDRDRKMKAELAKEVWSIQKLILDGKHQYGTPDFAEVHLAITTLATKLEAADSKTEASE